MLVESIPEYTSWKIAESNPLSASWNATRRVLPMSAAASGSAAAARSTAARRLRKQRLDDDRGRYLAASGRVLSAPELGEVGDAACHGLVAKRHERGTGEGKLGRRRVHRAQLAHEPVHDAARRAPGEEVRE